MRCPGHTKQLVQVNPADLSHHLVATFTLDTGGKLTVEWAVGEGDPLRRYVEDAGLYGRDSAGRWGVWLPQAGRPFWDVLGVAFTVSTFIYVREVETTAAPRRQPRHRRPKPRSTPGGSNAQ